MKISQGTVWLTVAFALSAQDAAAYKGKEHSGVSEVALAVALSSLSPQLGADALPKIRAAFLDCANLDEDGKREIDENCIPFGALTKGSDLVFHVENLVPDPLTCLGDNRPETLKGLDRCHEQARACKADLRQRLELQGTDDDREVFRFAADRLGNKGRSFLNRLLAAHRNTGHFEACAAETYNRLHQLAIQQARERVGEKEEWWLLPLATEAVALHFLQDSFPPGHLLTPRTSTPDLLSRGLHNRINAEGAVAFVENAPSLQALRQALAANAEARLWLAKQLGLEEAAIDQGLQAAAPWEPTFYGDGSLGMKMADGTLVLVLLSARSIADVLAAGLASGSDAWRPVPDSTVWLDFTPWCGERDPQFTTHPYLDKDTLRRPGLDVRIGSASRSTADEVLAGYKQGRGYGEEEEEQFHRWVGPRLEVAAGMMTNADGDAGLRAEIAFVGGFSGSNDVALCDEQGKPTSDFFIDRSRHGFSAALNLRVEEWDSTEVRAATLLMYPRMGRIGLLHLNAYLAAEIGAERYYTRTHSADLPTWGGRFGLGLGLVFVEVGVKRGHAEKPGGGLRDDTSFSLGVRVQPLR